MNQQMSMKEHHRYAKRPCSQPEILNFKSPSMWRKLHFFYFTRRSARKSSRLSPTAFVQGSNGSGTRPNIALPKVALLLLWRCLSDDAWIRNLISRRPTLPARMTSSSSNKVAQHVGGPDTGQGTVQWDSSFVWVWGRDRLHVGGGDGG